MDTRAKIITIDQAQNELRAGKWTVVAGYFDPVTADVARFFDEISRELAATEGQRRMLVTVVKSCDALLETEARAVIVAALRAVEFVVLASKEELAELFVASDRVRLVSNWEADNRRSEEFKRLIISRQEPELTGRSQARHG